MFLFFILCVYIRLKSVITSHSQENDKANNAAFFQILISFFIQSEVVFPSLYAPSLSFSSVWNLRRYESTKMQSGAKRMLLKLVKPVNLSVNASAFWQEFIID